jgi:hypothetical protein
MLLRLLLHRTHKPHHLPYQGAHRCVAAFMLWHLLLHPDHTTLS